MATIPTANTSTQIQVNQVPKTWILCLFLGLAIIVGYAIFVRMHPRTLEITSSHGYSITPPKKWIAYDPTSTKEGSSAATGIRTEKASFVDFYYDPSLYSSQDVKNLEEAKSQPTQRGMLRIQVISGTAARTLPFATVREAATKSGELQNYDQSKTIYGYYGDKDNQLSFVVHVNDDLALFISAHYTDTADRTSLMQTIQSIH